MWNRPPEFSGWKIVTFRKHAPRKRNGEEKTDHCNSPDLNSSVFQIILGRQNPLVLGGEAEVGVPAGRHALHQGTRAHVSPAVEP